MRRSFVAGCVLLAAAAARAQSTATLRGVDVYRSAVLTGAEVHRRFDERLHRYVALRNLAARGTQEKAEELRAEMEKEVRALRGVMWAELRVSEYYTAVDHAMYAMFDVVDRADAPRLAFSPAPKAAPRDAGGLIADWRRYMAEGEALSRRGEMSVERPNCPGFYCLWGGTPELDDIQKRFVAGAAAHAGELLRILRTAADGDARAAALFLLSYSPSGADVVAYCQESLVDSDARVRGAALQILADVVNHHREVPVTLDRILPRLDDPSSSVRGKAMGLLVPLADLKEHRRSMLTAAPRLAALLKLSQPESRDLAFTLLGILSKKNFGRDDFAAWDAWAASAARP